MIYYSLSIIFHHGAFPEKAILEDISSETISQFIFVLKPDVNVI